MRYVVTAVADRVCGINGMAISQGLPLRIPAPRPRRTGWFRLFW